MPGEPDCDGRIEIGPLPESVLGRLMRFQGNLLESSSDACFRILVRHGQTQALRPSLWR
jgi:hypothetical protein